MNPAPNQADESRRRDLAKIAVARKSLGIDETTYRQAVERISRGRTRSAADLSSAERAVLLGEYRRAGWRPTRPKIVGRDSAAYPAESGKPAPTAPRATPTLERAALASKVRALLADAGRPDAYADAIARKRFEVDRWEWLGWADLKALVQMLAIDQQRREHRVERNP